MLLKLNGQNQDFVPAPATVTDLLAALALPRERVAVERNGTLIPRAVHDQEPLAEGDVVEVVTLVGGG